MAILTANQDGTILLDLSPAEQDTLASLQNGELDSYISLWLQERGKQVLYQRFSKLPDQQRATVLATLQTTDQIAPLGAQSIG